MKQGQKTAGKHIITGCDTLQKKHIPYVYSIFHRGGIYKIVHKVLSKTYIGQA